MKHVVFAVPGDLATATGGYVYDRRIVAELPKSGWRVDVLDIGASFPRATVAERATAHLQLAAVPAGQVLVIDGLAFGVMTDSAEALHRTHKLVALVHHPLAFETGLQKREAAKFKASERLALSFVHRAITTSATTARLLVQHYAVPPDKISVVLPGTDRVPLSQRPAGDVVNLLAVGSIVPRKGYDLLIAALGKIPDLKWRLVIAADPGRSPETARALEAQIASLRLDERVELAGVVSDERLAELYANADLFVLPSRYEGFGMAFTEAIAHGVPVIGTTAGAIPEAVPAGAGVLVAPDNVDELTLALMRLVGHPAERARLTAGARAAAATLSTWEESGRLFAQALDQAA
ncbi:MAG: glycosyltransferase family 4 protein [Xanthobacteraceae bacterium]|nr:glycosyltransferase family 4 protein [Xanthobacteraceae bacterium]